MSTPPSYPIEFQSLFFPSEEEFMRLESEFPFSTGDPGLSAYLFTRVKKMFHCAIFQKNGTVVNNLYNYGRF